jgi:hypothetical protein
MDLLPEEKVEITDTMKDMNNALQNAENVLNPLFELGSAQELEKILNPFEQAKFNIVVAYSINSLFYSTISFLYFSQQLLVYLKTQGIDPNNHAVKGELVNIEIN